MKVCNLFAGLLSVGLLGCQPTKDTAPAQAKDSASSSRSAQATVDPIEKQIESLQKRVKALEFDKTMRDVEKINAAWFDPQEAKKYTPVKSPAGPVLMVLENMQPYLDGYSVTFRLGNPTTATLSGVKGKISWGPMFDPKQPDADLTMQSKQFDDPTVFPAGAWTLLKINIGPASAAQARQISIEPVFDQVSLRRNGL